MTPTAITGPRKFKPFGVKAHQFAFRPPAQDKRITILEGAVRSSKTWQQIVKIVMLCRYKVDGQRLLIGKSKATIKSNVLTDLFELVGNENHDYNQQSGELRLFDTHWRVLGAGDEGSERYLRGSTVGVAVSDELTLTPKSFTMMLLSRLSPVGARWYSTTNADNPHHYVKTDIIDNPDLVPYLDVISFGLDDNPNLDEDYKSFIKLSYTGVWYKRFILGLWIAAQGSIFGEALTDDIFYDDDTRPIGLLHRNGHVEKWVSIDAGVINPQAYGLFYDDGHTVWLEAEYYFSSKEHNFQKTDVQYANDLVNGYGGPDGWPGFPKDERDWPGVIIDPSAASFRLELMNRSIYVTDADNTVEDGIRRVSSMLSRKKLRIHRRCKNIIRDLMSYVWDDKASERGEEKPVKSHDHGCDLVRYYVETRIPDWRIAA